MLKVHPIKCSLVRALSHYKSAAKKKRNPIVQHNGEPLITCKRPEFNLYRDDSLKENANFGTIPLTSDGWHHYKSKGDYFSIHPHSHSTSEDITIDSDCQKPFAEFISIPELQQNISSRLNMQHTTFIQQKAFSQILKNKHTLIAAETGCGKTIAYLAPMLHNVLKRKRTIQSDSSVQFNTPIALIITPSRELAQQIGEVCRDLTHGLELKTKILIGGHAKQLMMDPDIEEVDVLVASVGVLSKLITTNIYRMHEVRHVVLDEADTLLDDSFSGKVQYILKNFPFHNNIQKPNQNEVATQLILASATMPSNIEESLKLIIDTDTLLPVVSPYLHKVMPHITQKFIRIRKSQRPIELLSLVKKDIDKKRPVIIFSNKKVTSDYVSIFLNDHDIETASLNNLAIEKLRRQQFKRFQTGQVNVLSTTDVASRGLDTKRACHVINFEFPNYISDYIHRCGRIGRYTSANDCKVTNFISGLNQLDLVRKIEHAVRTRGVLPNVNANINRIISDKIMREVEKEEQQLFKGMKKNSMN